MASVLLSKDVVPALGDLRVMGKGDSIFLRNGWAERRDGSRYADAITSAISRGADVRWVR